MATPNHLNLGSLTVILFLIWVLEAMASEISMGSRIIIREATIDDLDAITQIAIDVYPQLDAIVYQYPYADQYPEDYRKCTYEETKRLLQNIVHPKKDMRTMVAEIEDNSGRKTTISYASWDIMALKEKSEIENTLFEKRAPCSERRDADWKRIEYLKSIVETTQWKYLESSNRTDYPRSYIHMERFSTSPKWQRHGAGTLLLKWGLDLAQERSLQIGLFAAPAGRSLYRSYGFREVTRALVQMPGEEESVERPAMKWFPETDSELQGLQSLINDKEL